MTKISIAMATYNGERFVRQQLDSFARQTLLPTELVVCDDRSTDSTVSIIDDFSRSAVFPVRIVNNSKRLGHTANFLQAARLCRGDLIAFSDQDDVWLPEKLTRVHEASRDSDALILAHAVEWVDKDGNSTGIIFPTHRRYRKYLRMNDFPGHSIVISGSLLEMTSHSLAPNNYKEVAGDLEFGHDNLLLEIANAMGRVHFIPDVLARWRVYSQSNHAWTNLLGRAPRARISFADWMFPSDLAQTYAAAGMSFRTHAALLSCIIRDLFSFGGDAADASARLTLPLNLLIRRADVMDQRARFYSSRSRKARVRLMLEGAAMGQYRRAAQGGAGIHNALRDILACLLPM